MSQSTRQTDMEERNKEHRLLKYPESLSIDHKSHSSFVANNANHLD